MTRSITPSRGTKEQGRSAGQVGVAKGRLDRRYQDVGEERIRAALLRHRPDLLFKTGLEILFHQNGSTMISLSRKGCEAKLRLHRIFCFAPRSILEAVARCFFTPLKPGQKRRLRALILDFVQENREVTLAGASLPSTFPPKGQVYDLVQIQREVTKRYVPERRKNPNAIRVAWSKNITPSLMGKWVETPSCRPNLIIVNRLLDSRRVPRYYVEYIVYHEILHDLFPIRRERGKWIHHPCEFRKRERLFRDYTRARHWEREHLQRLVSSPRQR